MIHVLSVILVLLQAQFDFRLCSIKPLLKLNQQFFHLLDNKCFLMLSFNCDAKNH